MCEYSQKVRSGLKVRPYKLDLDQDSEALLAWMHDRNPDLKLEEHNKFLLAN